LWEFFCWGDHINREFNELSFLEAKGEYHEIDSHVYYFDLEQIYNSRDRALSVCVDLNMTLITFETREKWDTITQWMRK